MFIRIQLEPENSTFGELMGNGKKYTIPPFQRDYSWEEEQLSELWDDIENMSETKTQHFMGYVVLESKDGKDLKIIDGQQRLTSLIVFTISVLHRLKQLIAEGKQVGDNKTRLSNIHSIYLGVFSNVTLTTTPKLTLNRNNKEHLREIIDNEYDVPRQHGITATNRKLNKALQYFQKKMSSYDDGVCSKQIAFRIFKSFFFPFSSFKFITVAIAILQNFA